MGLRDRLFRRRAAMQQQVDYRVGMTVACQRCNRDVLIKDPFPPETEGKLVFGASPADDTACRCRNCGYIMCVGCAFGGQDWMTCPSCKKVRGPAFFVLWLIEKARGDI